MPKKLCLGTVQFGLKYGVNNALGRQPTQDEVFQILQTAIDHEIFSFDTSKGYGNSEELLGKFSLAEKNHVKIFSKVERIGNRDNVEKFIVNELQGTLQRLKAKKIYGYMLHDANDLKNSEVIPALTKLKNLHLCEKIGVSIYEPEDALQAVKNPAIDFIQIPYNVFDQRLDDTEFFALAKKNHTEIFARSSFLQGLLLMTPDEAEQHVPHSKDYMQKFQTIIKKNQFNAKEAAMLFVYDHPHIDYVVFGIDTVEQLQENIKLIERAEEFLPCFKKLHGEFKNLPRSIIIPSLWREKM